MKVVLGSTSEDKKRILQLALKDIDVDVEVTGIAAKSEITDLPWGVEVTKQVLLIGREMPAKCSQMLTFGSGWKVDG